MPRGKSARSARRAAPRPVKRAPASVPAQSANNGSMLGTVAEGMAFGAGSAVAHRVVDSVLGPRTIQRETLADGPSAIAPAPTANSLGSDACNIHLKAFQDCLNSNGTEISKCQFYMDMLADCKRNSGATLSA